MLFPIVKENGSAVRTLSGTVHLRAAIIDATEPSQWTIA